MTKEILKWVVGLIVIIVATSFFIYAAVGFFGWILNDPFNWIADNSEFKSSTTTGTLNINQVDIEKCRKDGGYAVLSSWDFSLKKCDFKN